MRLTMSIQELLSVVPGPATPQETGDEQQWHSLQQTLGIALPQDWRDFGRYYGTGRFYDPDRLGIVVLNPFRSDTVEGISLLCDQYRGFDGVPYDIFPKKPGL